MPIRAISFDLDDTFWPIRPVIERAERRLKQWIAQRHPELVDHFTPERLLALRDTVLAENPGFAHDLSMLRRLTLKLAMRPAGCTEQDVEEAFEVFFSARNEVQLYPDVQPALEALASRYRLITLSNGNADVHRIGLGHFFEASIAARDVGVAKPAPAIFEHAVAELDLAPHEVLHVGDDLESDVAGALRAGLAAVWVNRDTAQGGQQPVPVVRTLAELPDLLTAR
ncbi:MAG: HAD-IA family hydrolase [Pseudomonadota bacterium]